MSQHYFKFPLWYLLWYTVETSLFNGGSMIVDFFGYPYVLTNISQSHELSYIVVQQTSYPWNYGLTYPAKCWQFMNIAPPLLPRNKILQYFIKL